MQHKNYTKLIHDEMFARILISFIRSLIILHPSIRKIRNKRQNFYFEYHLNKNWRTNLQ